MAFMSQEKKKKIAAELKKVVPSDWKWSLGVRHHSTIVLTVAHTPKQVPNFETTSFSVNPYYFDQGIHDEFKPVIAEIIKALNLNNHDRSDAMTDYTDVGHYVDLSFGKWNKPYTFG